MAHKHSRHRSRPRSRNRSRNLSFNQSSDFSSYLPNGHCFEPGYLSMTPMDLSLPPSYLRTITHRGSHQFAVLPPYTSSVALRTPVKPVIPGKQWQRAWQKQEQTHARLREIARLEAAKIKVFGGEPGEEDSGLCVKMSEAFDGMVEWLDDV